MTTRECCGLCRFRIPPDEAGGWDCDCGLSGAPGVPLPNFPHRPADLSREELTRETPILAFFSFAHLPPHLRAVSEPTADLAFAMAGRFKPSAELSAGLRKLLEAKDCFVRAAL